MDNNKLLDNPFAVYTPENLTAGQIVSLFVAYPEFSKFEINGHQFIDGHRGSGKSMMLRMMCPDCQSIEKGSFLDIKYFGVYIPIKTTIINNPEFLRIENELGGSVLSESLLTITILSFLFQNLKEHASDFIATHTESRKIESFMHNEIYYSFRYSGVKPENLSFLKKEIKNIEEAFSDIIKMLDEIYSETVMYIKRRALTKDSVDYNGPLLGFQDTVMNIIDGIQKNNILPNIPIYFLLDDADNLSELQTKVLNTWVSYRFIDKASLKISTQLNYKTYETISGVRIQAPHDFSRIEFTTNRTGSKKEGYLSFLKEIVEKRLELYGINKTAEEFFPSDKNQEIEIKKIEEIIKNKYEKEGRGYRQNDDVYRYARPEYIRLLTQKKASSNYSYSGFKQLVNISTGIVRYFLDPAASMYSEQQKVNKNMNEIDPTIQDRVVREEAGKLLNDFYNISTHNDRAKAEQYGLSNIDKLQNLINGLGEIFKAHILDELESQRRLDSFTISGNQTQELKDILNLGLIHGYLYKDIRGSRDGLGRETRYVLTRRLAPMFSLDPNGYSGDKSLPADLLQLLMNNPKAYTSSLRTKGTAALNQGDLPLFTEVENDR